MNIGIFGVTANPPHLSHIKAINVAASQLDEVWVTPVYTHPFGKSFISYEQRVKMLELLVDEYSSKNVFIKELDKLYYETKQEMVYSYNLLVFLKQKYPEHNFKLIIGEDNYKPEIWNKFFNATGIEKEFGLVIIRDEGIHSTYIRNNINENIIPYVGKKVADFIIQNNLYKRETHAKPKYN